MSALDALTSGRVRSTGERATAGGRQGASQVVAGILGRPVAVLSHQRATSGVLDEAPLSGPTSIGAAHASVRASSAVIAQQSAALAVPLKPVTAYGPGEAEALLAALHRDIASLSATHTQTASDVAASAPDAGATPSAASAGRGSVMSATAVRQASLARLGRCLFELDIVDAPTVASSASPSISDAAPALGRVCEHGEAVSVPTHTALHTHMPMLLPALTKPVLKRWADPQESVRVPAIRMMACLLSAAADLSPVLPYLIPALGDRVAGDWVFSSSTGTFAADVESLDKHMRGSVLGQSQGVLAQSPAQVRDPTVQEPSEVARLGFVRNGTMPVLGPYMGDIVMLCHALAMDASPEVKIAGLGLFEPLCTVAAELMRIFAAGLVRSFMVSGLDHKLARVRVAALSAIDVLVACPNEVNGRGAGSEAVLSLLGGRDANVVPVAAFYGRDTSVNYFAKLIADGNKQVRQRFVLMLTNWMTRMLDRHEWWSRLLPYVLTAYSDESSDVSTLARACIAECGRQHESEHSASILERVQHGIDGEADGEFVLSLVILEPIHRNTRRAVPYDRCLPPPIVERPRMGVRWFVRAHARRFLGALTSELATFSTFALPGGEGTRVRAAQLLAMVLLHMEENSTQDAADLVGMLVKCADDGSLQPWVAILARLLGRFVHPKGYCPILLRHAIYDVAVVGVEVVTRDAERTSLNSLRILAAALAESPASRVRGHASETLSALLSTEVLNAVYGELRAVPHTQEVHLRHWVDTGLVPHPASDVTGSAAHTPSVVGCWSWLRTVATLVQHVPHAFTCLTEAAPATTSTAAVNGLTAARALLQNVLGIRGTLIMLGKAIAGDGGAAWRTSLTPSEAACLQPASYVAKPMLDSDVPCSFASIGFAADAVLSLLLACPVNPGMSLFAAACERLRPHALPMLTAVVTELHLDPAWHWLDATPGALYQLLCCGVWLHVSGGDLDEAEQLTCDVGAAAAEAFTVMGWHPTAHGTGAFVGAQIASALKDGVLAQLGGAPALPGWSAWRAWTSDTAPVPLYEQALLWWLCAVRDAAPHVLARTATRWLHAVTGMCSLVNLDGRPRIAASSTLLEALCSFLCSIVDTAGSSTDVIDASSASVLAGFALEALRAPCADVPDAAAAARVAAADSAGVRAAGAACRALALAPTAVPSDWLQQLLHAFAVRVLGIAVSLIHQRAITKDRLRAELATLCGGSIEHVDQLIQRGASEPLVLHAPTCVALAAAAGALGDPSHDDAVDDCAAAADDSRVLTWAEALRVGPANIVQSWTQRFAAEGRAVAAECAAMTRELVSLAETLATTDDAARGAHTTGKPAALRPQARLELVRACVQGLGVLEQHAELVAALKRE